MAEALDFPDNVWLYGYWGREEYFADVADILRREFTLKNPLSSTARHWQEKIQAAECSVSLHVRHCDFLYSPINAANPKVFAILPLDYYRTCVAELKKDCPNLTAFVFSNNLQWCKENLHTGVPTEFVEGCAADVEELYLMSLCNHNVISKSTFSRWGAWLNQNPDKKVYMPGAFPGEQQSYYHGETDPRLDTGRWIRVPFTPEKPANITMRPYFSVLLVVNDDAATLAETFATVLGQDYRWFEMIIVDNASTDGSGKLCRQVAQTRDNVTLVKFHNKVSLGAAWNKALDLAQGEFVMFLRGNDRLLANALSSMYLVNEHPYVDAVNSVIWLKESANGNVDLAGRKFVAEKEAAFQSLNGIFRAKLDKATLLRIWASNGGSTPLGTKIFKRKFLDDNAIRFCDAPDAELLFVINAMFRAEENLFVPNIFYIAPRK